NITVIEPVDSKRALALLYGAKHVLDPLTENVFSAANAITNNHGFSSVLETSGSISGFNNAISVLGNLGKISALYLPLGCTDHRFRGLS
ncbi:MAG: zinc-binding dehydrogenase, partial [Oscillospiraceae bacterium]|nr:zinc-binding dehydrogenase [Oscillospiraceae bacterium]